MGTSTAAYQRLTERSIGTLLGTIRQGLDELILNPGLISGKGRLPGEYDRKSVWQLLRNPWQQYF